MKEKFFLIHKKYAPSKKLLDIVWSHSLIVGNIFKF